MHSMMAPTFRYSRRINCQVVTGSGAARSKQTGIRGRGSVVRVFLKPTAVVLLPALCHCVAAVAQDEASVEPNGSSSKILYLANPYGFSAQQREGPLVALVTALEDMGAEVWEPFTRTSQIDTTSPGWAYRIGQADLRDVRDADGLFAVVNGCPPDEGVMVELGMAIAWGKPVFLFRDDFRRCTDSESYPLNLMVFTGLPETGWEAFWYSAIEEIADPGKALAQWLSGGPAAVATGSTGSTESTGSTGE